MTKAKNEFQLKISFNKPYFTGKETVYAEQAVASGKISGNGDFTKLCQAFFEQRYDFGKCLLTSSCTDALEMAAILLDILPGDEVIMPSYTFVSTANAFVLRGATIVFADSGPDHPNIDASQLENLITPKTKAIVVVHYAGMACDMAAIMSLAEKHGLFVVEDAAQAVDSYYLGEISKKMTSPQPPPKGELTPNSEPPTPNLEPRTSNPKQRIPLGSIGHLAAFSFHETKNIISGEGGMLVVNDKRFMERAEIIWEKGTNRAAFWRGEVNKYGWVDVGSSFLPSEITAAFLFAQLEHLDAIQNRRKEIWKRYYDALKPLAEAGHFQLLKIPPYATNNAHCFFLVMPNVESRDKLIAHLKSKGILAVFHYISLHSSPYYTDKHDGRVLPNSDHYSECLVRLPLFFELTEEDQNQVVVAVKEAVKS